MNRKRTNRLVAILNVIAVVSIYMLEFSAKYLLSNMMIGDGEAKSIFNSFIIDTLLNNIQIITALVYSGVGILNIICAIQNKENKKICFWQFVFGICEVWNAISIALVDIADESEVIEWIDTILFEIVPIILAIINIILIKKNKPKLIQIISYIAVIILSILSIIEIIGHSWIIVAIIMQLIYIHFQDKYIKESSSRKIVNIILYYIIQVILVVGFLGMILVSVLTTKINEVKWQNELSELYNNIETLQGAEIEEVYVPVENDFKYGFVNDSGQEKIQCQYDRVSYFNELEINNNLYYVALVKKDNKFYIISKNNDNIMLSGNLEKYLQTLYEHWGETMDAMFNEQGDYRNAYVQTYEFFFQAFTKGEMELSKQTINQNNTNNTIDLTEENSKYYYNGENYDMIIEPIYEETNEKETDDEDENTYYSTSDNTKHKVTIIKTNGEQRTSIIYLTDFDEDDATIDTFTDGYIGFEDEENERNGWIDENGNKITVPNTYIIRDIKNDKVILQTENTYLNEKTEYHFIIVDMSGRTLLETTALDIYDDIYLVKNGDNKMVLMDKDLNVISNEYDKIISTMSIDIAPQYSSYY